MHHHPHRLFSRSYQPFTGSIAMHRHELSHHRLLRCEMLEDRRLLSVVTGFETDANEAIQHFSTSTALFVENQGQWADETVRYEFNGNGVNIAFTDDGLAFLLSQREAIDGVVNEHEPLQHDLEMEPFDRFDDPDDYITHSTQFTVQFDGANAVTPIGLQQAESYFNYYVGNQANRRSHVPGYEVVAYENLYDGIDLHTFGRRDSLKYEFYVAPGADYSQISISYDGIHSLWIDDTGALHVETELGELIDDAPYIFQTLDGQQTKVDGRFVLVDTDTYTFQITGAYDPNSEIIIDPDLVWSSYLGGSGYDDGYDIAVDADGNALVTGVTFSYDWVTGGWDLNHNGEWDGFVVKLSASGDHLWSSYLGGSDMDIGCGIAVDGGGNALVTGETRSSGWISGGWDTSYNGGYDPFVMKLSASGDHLWSSYLGGGSDDYGYGIAVDGSGNALVTGFTYSHGWVSGGWDLSHNGSEDGFVVKLSAGGGHLWSSYLGGSGTDWGEAIAVDDGGNALVTGFTDSSNWVSGGWDTSFGGYCDTFVVKLSAGGGHLWSSYLGGSYTDFGYDIAVDSAGNALVTGFTESPGWISLGWDINYNGNVDGFVVKLSAGGGHLWSSYLGGSSGDCGHGIAVDGGGNALVTGFTYSHGWVSGGWDLSHNGSEDGFVVKLSASGSHLWSSYLGGSGWDEGHDIAVDGGGDALVVGYTESSGWISGGWDTTYNGEWDAFVVKINGAGTPTIDVGDRLSTASDLGTLSGGTTAMRTGYIGNGSYPNKDVDLYRFALAKSGTVELLVTEYIGQLPAPTSLLDSYLRLLNASGNQITANDAYQKDLGGGIYQIGSRIESTLAAGTYYAGVSGYPNRYYNPTTAGSGLSGSSAGSYTLKINLESLPSGSWVPLITATSEFDYGGGDPTVFGRYLTGDAVEELLNTFTVSVLPTTGYSTVAVTFDANFNGIRDAGDHMDSTGTDGWTWTTNVSVLPNDPTLTIWAKESGGAWSNGTGFTIDTLALPSWMDPEWTYVRFNAFNNKYEIESLDVQQFGFESPEWFPDFVEYHDGEKTYNGIHFGTSIKAESSLSGHVNTHHIAPCFGWSFLGVGYNYVFATHSALTHTHIEQSFDLFAFNDLYVNASEFISAMRSPAAGYYDTRNRGQLPKVSLIYDGHGILDNDLLFVEYSQSLTVSFSTVSPLLRVPIPPVPFPLPFGLSLIVTPHIGLSPYFDFNFSRVLDENRLPHFESASVEIGVHGEIGVAAEVAFIGGFVRGGVDVTGSIDVGFQAEFDGEFKYSIPTSIGVEIDFVGSLLWGSWSGRYNVLTWSVEGDLWSPGSVAGEGPYVLSGSGSGKSDIIPVESGIARSENGSMAYSLIATSQDGTAQPLTVQMFSGVAWQPAETILNSSHLRGTPAIVSLGGDDWMVMWSESNLVADNLDGLTDDQIVAEQELWYAIRSEGTWGSPARFTSDGVADDSPSLARRSDGTVISVWRRMGGTDVTNHSLSDLAYATWDGISWSSPTLLADTGEALGNPAMTVLPNDNIAAVWISDAGEIGEDLTVWTAQLEGTVWSTPERISDEEPTVRSWCGVAGLDDGTVLAVWTEENATGVVLMVSRGMNTGRWEWSTPEIINNTKAVLSDPQIFADGNLVRVIYHTYDEENEIVGISRDFSDPASQWGDEETLTPEAGEAGWAVGSYDNESDVHVRYILDLNVEAAEVAPLPDLTIDPGSFGLLASPPAHGELNVVHVTVANTGWAASNSNMVVLYNGDPTAGGVLIGFQSVSSLAVGESSAIEIPWTPAIGNYDLWLVVDFTDVEAEGNEENNVLMQSLAVLESPTISLDPASNTGSPDDEQTADTTPTLIGSAPTNTTITAYVDTQDIPAASVVIVGTDYSITLPALENGWHTLWVQAFDLHSNPSPFSEALMLYIDAPTIPTFAAPDLDPSSDTGVLGDGITSIPRPTFIGAAKPDAIVKVYSDDLLLGETIATTDGSYVFTPESALGIGDHEIYVIQSDASGDNPSLSEILDLIILASADFDTDGDVDGDDLGIWKDGYGTTTGANLCNGDADADGDVDGNDFLAWQLNFGSTTASGYAAKSPSRLTATDHGSGAFLSKTNAPADSTNNAKGDPADLVRSIVGNGQDTFIVPLDRQGTSFETVDYAGWSMPQPMPKTNGNTTAWLGLLQFQSRDASQLFQHNRAVDAVMSRLDERITRFDLQRVHAKVMDITLVDSRTAYDEMWKVSSFGKTTPQQINGHPTTVQDKLDLEVAPEESTTKALRKFVLPASLQNA